MRANRSVEAVRKRVCILTIIVRTVIVKPITRSRIAMYTTRDVEEHRYYGDQLISVIIDYQY